MGKFMLPKIVPLLFKVFMLGKLEEKHIKRDPRVISVYNGLDNILVTVKSTPLDNSARESFLV